MTKNQETKTLILSLIKDDLINSKLIHSLIDIGIDASDYTLHLRSTIFRLMNIGDSLQSDIIHDHYFELTRRTKHIDITERSHHLDDLSLEIYKYLSNT